MRSTALTNSRNYINTIFSILAISHFPTINSPPFSQSLSTSSHAGPHTPKFHPKLTPNLAWRKWATLFLLLSLQVQSALADNTGTTNLNNFIDPLKSGLNLITIFGFIAGCVMVMGGFLNARRDENWKMTVIYGIGVAGSVVLMKALFSIFGGTTTSGANIQSF